VSDIDSILINTNEYPNLDIFPTGPMPPNPAELLLSHNVVTLFDTLKQRYDYIIIDSAPAGMVSDAFILKDYADLTLYIIRQRYTLIKQMEFISEIKDTEKLINMSIVVNDVSMGGRYGYYGYNYGYGYGYSYQYGYGYKSNPNGGYYLSDSSQIQLPWWAHIIRWFGRIKK
jgi:Mrp family chromosome partitioning ATPase